jgi:hypothetical protein
MLLLNFSHPLTPAQVAQIEALAEQPVARVVEVHSQIDAQQPLGSQITALVDSAGLTPAQWQSEALLVNLPSLNYSAALVMAELHGRMGYFPSCVRLRPVPSAVPPQFEVAELLNLQATRDAARQRR